MTAEIRGVKELNRAFRELGGDVAFKIARSSTRAGAKEIYKELEAAAPVRSEPGPKSSTTKTKAGAQQGGVVGVRFPGHTKRELKIRAGRKQPGVIQFFVSAGRAFYWIFREFGTKHQAAQPWARPAYERSKGRAMDKIGERFWKGIKYQTKKLNKVIR